MENRTKGLDLLEDFISYRGNDGRELYHSIQNYLEKKLNGDCFTADDIMQEILLKTIRFKNKYDPSQRLSPWLFTVANNTLRDFYKSNKKRMGDVSLDRLSENKEENKYDLEGLSIRADENSEDNEEAKILRERIDRLPEKLRESMKLINFQEMTYTDTAEKLGIPVGTVKTRVRKGMEMLREDYGVHTKAA